MKRTKYGTHRLNRRERAARDALIDAATEVASPIGEPERGRVILAHESEALGVLYRANDEWQEAQMRGEEA